MKKGKGKKGKLLPNSLRIISSCIKTVSMNASTVVRSAGASVAASISSPGDDPKEQVLWASFDKLELSPTVFRRVLLLGYLKGFQVFDVEDAHGLCELVYRKYGPVTFLQMLPVPAYCNIAEYLKKSHPVLLVVGGDEDEKFSLHHNSGRGTASYGSAETSFESCFDPPTTVRFYSMKLNEYVKVFDFRSAVLMVRCSAQVVAIGLEEQIYCLDALTLERKFIVVTYPVTRVREQGSFGICTGYGPMAVGSRWLAYPPNRPYLPSMGRVSPMNLASSVSPSTSPGGSLMARYAVESGRQIATGILTLGDLGYKKLSKYCPEFLSDSPSSPGWKSGKLAASEPENAGVVAVKDLACSEVISQFRAHTSPISALCFDPSGTLLVTASVHGNNINIFRIMPSHTCNGSGSGDWTTSHVHLYKLHRGVTPAVIQDICFSSYSQWIAIVSSHGTCHIYVLSPFGKDDGFQALHGNEQASSLLLASSSPWWSTSSFTINEQPFSPPPAPCIISVITRIKCTDSGLLNSVSNAAASIAGKISVPSGAIAAIFHNSNSTGSLDVPANANSLEYILVYTPSGFVVQHEIQSSTMLDLGESRTGSRSAIQGNLHEEFRIKVEPIQWWDVCKRVDDLEREDNMFGSFSDRKTFIDVKENSKTDLQDECSAERKLIDNDSLKSAERAQWYLSNAEVQIKSCRLPLWQKTKIHFHVIEPPGTECYFGGEFEIETLYSYEVEIRHKDLLPIFDNFPHLTTREFQRSLPSEGGGFPNVSSDSSRAGEKASDARAISHSKPPSLSSTESLEGGMEKAVEYGNFFNEGYCNKPDLHKHLNSTELAPTDEVDTSVDNPHDEEKSEEGWIGGMFEFSEEG